MTIPTQSEVEQYQREEKEREKQHKFLEDFGFEYQSDMGGAYWWMEREKLGAAEGSNNSKDHQDITIGGDECKFETFTQIIGSAANEVTAILNGEERYFHLHTILDIDPDTVVSKEHVIQFLNILESSDYNPKGK